MFPPHFFVKLQLQAQDLLGLSSL